MKQVLIERLAKLLSVKSLVTLILTIAFVGMLFSGNIIDDTFKTIFTTIIAFYYGTQAKKE